MVAVPMRLACPSPQAHEGARQWAAAHGLLPTPPGSEPPTVYESTVLLHTGRTHQIRAQFAAVGASLVGDVMYQPIERVLVGESGLLQPELVPLVEQLPSLTARIGLHAYRLDWRGETFTAAPDWDAAPARRVV